jgi:putative copper export protein
VIPLGFTATSVLLAVHLGGFALWSGSLLGLLVSGPGPGSAAIRRQLDVAVLVMVVTLASGWTLAVAEQGSPEHWNWTANAMQALGIVMAVVLMVARFGALFLLDEAETGSDPEAQASAYRRIARLVAADLAISGVILAVAVAGRYG